MTASAFANVTFSSDRSRVDRERVHGWIANDSYWAAGIPRAVFDRAVDGSRVYGAYHAADGQIAFARVITDTATYAYLADVWVTADWRGRGVGVAFLEFIQADPELAGLRRWMLATRDAQPFYARLGWTPAPDPSILMQRHFPDVYRG